MSNKRKADCCPSCDEELVRLPTKIHKRDNGQSPCPNMSRAYAIENKSDQKDYSKINEMVMIRFYHAVAAMNEGPDVFELEENFMFQKEYPTRTFEYTVYRPTKQKYYGTFNQIFTLFKKKVELIDSTYKKDYRECKNLNIREDEHLIECMRILQEYNPTWCLVMKVTIVDLLTRDHSQQNSDTLIEIFHIIIDLEVIRNKNLTKEKIAWFAAWYKNLLGRTHLIEIIGEENAKRWDKKLDQMILPLMIDVANKQIIRVN